MLRTVLRLERETKESFTRRKFSRDVDFPVLEGHPKAKEDAASAGQLRKKMAEVEKGKTLKEFQIYRWNPTSERRPFLQSFSVDLSTCGPMVNTPTFSLSLSSFLYFSIYLSVLSIYLIFSIYLSCLFVCQPTFKILSCISTYLILISINQFYFSYLIYLSSPHVVNFFFLSNLTYLSILS